MNTIIFHEESLFEIEYEVIQGESPTCDSYGAPVEPGCPDRIDILSVKRLSGDDPEPSDAVIEEHAWSEVESHYEGYEEMEYDLVNSIYEAQEAEMPF